MGAAFRMYLLHLDASVRHGSPLGMPPFAQVECLFRATVEQAASQTSAAVLTSTEGMDGFLLPGAVRCLCACKLAWFRRQSSCCGWGARCRFVSARRWGVLSSGMSSDWTLASLGIVASSTLADAINTIESSFIDAIRSQCHGLTSLHANHHARSTCA
jgi:hypothetical protein